MIILGTNSIKDTGYNVANSLRFNIASSDSLTATVGSGGSTTSWTNSMWVKRSTLGADQRVFSIGEDSGDGDPDNLWRFKSDDTLHINIYNGSAIGNLITNRVFRDTSAWYHIVVVWNSANNTSSDRIQLYVNGVRETSFSTATYPSQNANSLTDGKTAAIGRRNLGGGQQYFGGYVAETIFVDGTSLSPTDVGEFDEDSGIWKPIDVSGLTFGTNGFYLDFEDSSALGNDKAGSNNFTVGNLTAIDQSTDTCTNNFATLNPLDVSLPSTFALSEGNLDGLMNGISSNAYARAYSNIQVASGKWYAECKITEEGDSGIIGVSARSGISYVDVSGTNYDWLGINAHDYRYYHDGTKMNNNSSSSYGTTWDGGDIIGIALDMDNLAVYFSLNGTFQASGDPTSGSSRTNAAFNLTAVASTPNGAYKFGIGTQGGTDVQGQWNFGSPPYAISSGNTDGNGFGNFEYAVPSGYFALCTKNLAGNS